MSGPRAPTARRRVRRVVAVAVTVLVAAGVGGPVGLAGDAGALVESVSWARLPGADQPVGNSEAQSVVVGGGLYSFGGFDGQRPCCSPTRRAYVLRPGSGWQRIADLPQGVTHAGMTTDGTDVFFAGGYVEKPGGIDGQLFGTTAARRYSVATDTYSRLPDLPGVVAGGALAYLDGRLHYMGGTTRGRTPADNRDVEDLREHWVLDLAGGATAWVAAAPLIGPGRTHFPLVAMDGRLWAVGGQLGHDGAGSVLGPLEPLGRVDVYDPNTDTWSARAALSPARNHHMSTTVVVDGRIIVMGGQVDHGRSVSDVDQYDPTTDRWTPLASLPVARHSAIGGYLGGKLYFGTGNGARDTYVGTLTRRQDDPAPAPEPGPEPGGGDPDGGATGGEGSPGSEPGDPPAPVGGAPARFVALPPARLVDTRVGLGAPAGAVPDGGTLEVVVAGRLGVPADATAVVVTITAVDATGPGYVQASPTGSVPAGTSSTLNVERAGRTVPNLAIVGVGEGGAISVHAQTATQVLVDVAGAWVPAPGAVRAGRLVPVAPTRVLDTRVGLGVDPAGAAPVASDTHVVPAGSSIRLAVPGVPADAAAVVLNVTAVHPEAEGFVQVVPADGTTPFGSSSNLNVHRGETVANLVVVAAAGGSVDLYTQARTHLVADLVGWVTGASAASSTDGRFVVLDPVRVLDTRSGAPPGPGGRADLTAASAGLPVAGVAALALNVTATGALAAGFVQVAPADQAVLGASSTLNVAAGGTVANAALALVGGSGVALLTQEPTHLVADVSGYVTGPVPPG